MAIIVEDGTGLATANSYASVSDVRVYFSIRPEDTAITALTDVQIENLLTRSTELLDLYFSYSGTRKTETQALEWPRILAHNTCTDRDVSDSIVPKEVQKSVIELVNYLRVKDTADTSSDYQDVIQSNEIKELELDVLRVMFNDKNKLNVGAVNGPKLSGLPTSIMKFMRCISDFRDGRWAVRRVQIIHEKYKQNTN